VNVATVSNSVQEPRDYFETWIAQARHSDRLLVVLDPERYLDLGDEVRAGRRTWPVYHYAENDLAFRAAYANRPNDPNFCHIVWITPSPYRRGRPDKLNLSFMADVLRRADRILDLSLAGLLRVLQPGEVFPDAALHALGDVLSSRLGILLTGHRELRKEIGPKQSLDIHHVRALALHCLQPAIPPSDFLFTQTNTRDVLARYLRLVWSGQVEEQQTMQLLQEHVAQSPFVFDSAAELLPWFQAPPDELALLIYVYRALQSYQVPNPFNQLRGLGLVTIDPTPLEPHLGTALALWEDESLRSRLVQRAEAALDLFGDNGQLANLITLLPLSDVSAVGQALQRETTPALVCGLAERFLSLTMRIEGDARDQVLVDAATLSVALADVETAYTDRARAVVTAIREMAFVVTHLQSSFTTAPDLASLIDGYVESGVYRLELARALAEEHVKQLLSSDLRRKLQVYLDQLQRRIWDYLECLDANLLSLISQDYDAFLNHPRLSTRLLRNTVLEPEFQPTRDQCVWILIFDGMRFDSWQEIVLPALTQYLEIVDAGKVYLCLLPSFTGVARTGLLAGTTPSGWRASSGRYTSNEATLAARLFSIDPAERDHRLRIEAASETDTVQRRLGGDIDRRPINVLIYNISDDLAHNFRGHLAAMNGVIARQMQTVAGDLQRNVREGDLVVVTSDHGFVELDPKASIPVSDEILTEQGIEGSVKEHVFYRYLVDLEHSDGLRVPFLQDQFYTVAQGRAWFQRKGGHLSRYSHGGISLGEMVVPGATMQRIVKPFIKLALLGMPRQIQVLEKEPQTLNVTLRNDGNHVAKYVLTFNTNTDPDGQTVRGTLGPRQAKELSYTFTPVYTPKETDRVTVQGTYTDVDGREKRVSARSAAITTQPRKDVVEIGFGGLDQLDEL
jgi:hypothetical protein